MKSKKFKLAAVSFLAVLALAGCSSSKEIATMKGGKITEEDLYTELKKSSTTNDTLTSLILNKVVDNAYGDKVDSKEIDKQYNEVQEQYGGKTAFEDILKQNKLDTKTYKESIKTQLAFEAMLKAHVKVTEDDMKETWKTFHPSVDVQLMSFTSQDDAKAALDEVNSGDKSFEDVAKEKSTDTTTKEDGGKVTFDSSTTTDPVGVSIPEEVKEAAYKLEDGKVSDVITAANATTGADTYYVVKMIKNQKKGNDYKKFEKELKEATINTKITDTTFRQEVIADELDKANVKIKDADFKNILDAYLPQKEDKSTSSSTETKSSDKDKTESTDESTEASK